MAERLLLLLGLGIFWAPALGAQSLAFEFAAPDSTALIAAAFAQAIQVGREAAQPNSIPLMVCLYRSGPEPQDPPSSLLAALAKPDSVELRPRSRCPEENASRILAYVGPLEIAANGLVSLRIGYYENGMSAGEWRCQGKQTAKEWRVSCILDWIALSPFPPDAPPNQRMQLPRA